MDILSHLNYKLNITVVEDDPIIVQDISGMLESIGHRVVGRFTSGEDFFEHTHELDQTDIIILDIELQGRIDGIQIALELKRSRQVPIIYLTSYTDTHTVQKILKTEPYGFLLKPAQKEELSIAINIANYKFVLDRKIRASEKRYQSIVETLPLMIARIDPRSGSLNYCNNNFCELFGCCSEQESDSFFTLVEQKGFSGLREDFEKLSFEENSRNKEILIKVGETEKERWFKIICQALFEGPALLFEYQFICEDITERKVNEKELQTKTEELNSRIKDLKCLFSISRTLYELQSLDKMLQKVSDEIATALNDSDNIAVCIEYGDKSFYSYNYFSSPIHFNNPVEVSGSVVGNIRLNLTMCKSTESFLSDEQYALISTAAELISKTVEKIETTSQLKKLEREIIMISEREKQNLGHELHDGIGQILTGTSFILKSLEKKLESKGLEKIQELEDVIGLVKDATVKCRRLSKGLVPVSYSSETFAYLVEQLLHSTKQLYNIEFDLQIPDTFDISNSFVTSQLFRIVQEVVNNTVKHAHADMIEVLIEKEHAYARLVVSDNGTGIKRGTVEKGLGMSIMRYRSDLIGADFDVISQEGHGTTVVVRLPLELVKHTAEEHEQLT